MKKEREEIEIREMELDDLPQEACFVAQTHGRIVGFILGNTLTKYRSAWKYGHLTWIGVDNDYRKIGIANRLFEYFMELMQEKKVRMIIADTEADNKIAIDFFKKKGFGKAEKHVYMSLNIASKKKKKNRK